MQCRSWRFGLKMSVMSHRLRRRLATLLLAVTVGAGSPAAAAYAPRIGPSTQEFTVTVAPGVQLSAYDEKIGTRTVRYYDLSVDWRTPGVAFQLLQPPTRDQVEPVTVQASRTPRVVGATNGDYFDIDRTGAPLGIGVRAGTVQHGRTNTGSHAFYVDSAGVPRVGTLTVALPVRRRPGFGLTSFNAPWVTRGGIGVYDARWGQNGGFTWTQGQRSNVLMAHLVNHRVVAFRSVFQAREPIVGEYLVARGANAVRRLRHLRVGNWFRYRRVASGTPRMAVSGDQIVLAGGRVVATDDVELHPRTAVCVDPTRHRVHLLVADGRQESSGGYTLVEVGQRLAALGCSSGLNLDGGGSSTLVARQNGTLNLINVPSGGGVQRNVANALGVTFTP
jgi:hypothetical protein